MNDNLANEIRKAIESVKNMKIQVGGINNYLSTLEELLRSDNQKKEDEAYQRGLEDGQNKAWETARKVVLSPDEDGVSIPDLFMILGNSSMQNVFRNYSASEAIEKMKAYEEKRKAREEIKVGDFSALIDYLSQFDESDVAKVKYIRQKIEAAIGENVDWYERRKS